MNYELNLHFFFPQALDIPELAEMEQPVKPDPDKYFFERPSSGKRLPKLPALADSKFFSI